MNRIPNYTKQELCDAVYRAVYSAQSPLTRLEICRAIGRKKSEHIITMIETLTSGGWLVKTEDKDKFGRDAFKYRVGQISEPDCAQVGA